MANNDQPRGFQWKRSSALSTTLALHALAALAMLAPPGLMPSPKAAPPTVQAITLRQEEPPPPPPPPKLEPVRHKPKTVPRPQVARQEIRPQQPVVTDLPTPMSVPAVPDPAPPEPIAPPPADTAPTALGYRDMKQIPYPKLAMQQRLQGTVMLRVLVGADGAPQKVEIERSSGHVQLDRAARDGVMKWRFEPGTRNGVAYAAWGLVPVTFNLSEL